MAKEVWQEAEQFIRIFYTENAKPETEMISRLGKIKHDLNETGSYTHTYDELIYGAKLAWRNSNRCIGRLFWDSLHVLDKRHLNTEEEIKESLLEHIEIATNQGRIRPVITIFPQETPECRVRILNHQLIRYAGYETEQGIIGDPASIPFTQKCLQLGWKSTKSHFDVLPLAIQINDARPRLFDIPEHLVKEVAITHPEFSWFSDMQIKWYAVPIISSMRLEIGGIDYHAAPFNGWYMGTEIGARNLADEDRYNLLPRIANLMELDTHRNSSLWKDRALVELNAAVLYSYKEAGVSIVDHHTAAQQFKLFEDREQKEGRPVTGDWTWLIPPISPAATHIFHQSYTDGLVKPNFFYS